MALPFLVLIFIFKFATPHYMCWQIVLEFLHMAKRLQYCLSITKLQEKLALTTGILKETKMTTLLKLLLQYSCVPFGVVKFHTPCSYP